MKALPPNAELLLVGDIYDAALNPALWPTVLQRLAALTAANSAIITALDALNPAYNIAVTHNIPEQSLRAYQDEGMETLEREFHGRPLVMGGVGSALLSTEVYGSQEEYVRRGGKFYERCLKPSNIHFLAGTLLEYDDFRWGALGVHRPAEWEPLTRQHTDFLQRMTPHVRRALQIHRQITAVQQQNARLYQMLDAMMVGVLLLDGTRRLRFANPAAEALLREHDSLRLTPRKELQAAYRASNGPLQALLRHTILTGRREPDGEAPGNVIGLPSQDQDRLLMLTVTPLSALTGYADLAGDGIAAAVFLSDPAGRRRLARGLLRDSYGLSERECDLCEAFVNHASLEGMAEACGLSLSSVRTYLKDIYDKTGQHSQAELMRLLMGLRMDFDHIR